MEPRKKGEYLEWEDEFMVQAFSISQRSKDPSTQVGACAVDNKTRAIGVGYNGFPKTREKDGVKINNDVAYSWKREEDKTKKIDTSTKYPFVVHAEMNAISNLIQKDDVDKMYVTLFPCNECAKLITQTGFNEIIYFSDKYNGTDGNKAAKYIFDTSGVSYRQYKPTSIFIRQFSDERLKAMYNELDAVGKEAFKEVLSKTLTPEQLAFVLK